MARTSGEPLTHSTNGSPFLTPGDAVAEGRGEERGKIPLDTRLDGEDPRDGIVPDAVQACSRE